MRIYPAFYVSLRTRDGITCIFGTANGAWAKFLAVLYHGVCTLPSVSAISFDDEISKGNIMTIRGIGAYGWSGRSRIGPKKKKLGLPEKKKTYFHSYYRKGHTGSIIFIVSRATVFYWIFQSCSASNVSWKYTVAHRCNTCRRDQCGLCGPRSFRDS